MTLRTQLLLAFAYVLLLIIVALEVPLALNLARRIDAEVKNDAATQAFVVAANASGRIDRPQRLAEIVRLSGNDLGARVIVVNKSGRLLADSTVRNARRLSYASRPEIHTALGGGRAQGSRHSDTLGQDLLYTAVPVTSNGNVVGAVRVTQSLGAVHAKVRRGVLALVAIGGFALVVGLAFAWFLASSLSKPLRSLAATARRVEAGDLSARAEAAGANEQREVAAAFNDMTERLELVLAAQREFVANASHQLRTPLTGLRLRLESARGKAGAGASRELVAAEQEVERMAGLLTSLLTLARDGDEPGGGPDRIARAGGRARTRALGPDRRAGRPGARTRGRRRRHDRLLGRGPGDSAGQPDRERAALLAVARPGRLGSRRRRGVVGRPRRRARPGGGRGDPALRALRARPRGQRQLGNGPGARDRADAGAPLARDRLARQPGRGRHARRGALPGCGYRAGKMGRSLVVALLALLGLLCAAGMGYAAYVVSRGSVAVPVTRLQPSPQQLTPAGVRNPPRATTRTRATTSTSATATTTTATATVDDHGGRRGRGSGSGSDDGGGGSSGGGSGSSGRGGGHGGDD